MAKYEPIGFEDEVPNATPLKYKITDDTEGVIAESATIELETPVIPGTPLNAANLNHIEQGIVDLEASTPPGVFQTKGDLFVGTGSKTGVRLPVGANGRVLRANNAKAEGVEWGVDPIDMMAAKGDLVVGTGTDSAVRLPVGTNGQVLIADSAQNAGIAWFSLLARRQGGSPSDWSLGGTSNYEPGKFKIQIGVFPISISPSSSSMREVAFPQPFSAPPIVIGPMVYRNGLSNSVDYTGYIAGVYSSRFYFVIINRSNDSLNGDILWLAIGPA